jgi:pantoate--beta-alanine ligase
VRLITSAREFSDALDAERAVGRRVGLVPTMGALHAGHRSLVARAADECDVVAVTVFVNPLQFDRAADLAGYPRDLEGDVVQARSAGATIVFAPSVEEMYPGFPAPVATSVHVDALGDVLEGASRPGHFDGVATVVAKLCSLAGRSRVYFGEKDFQQLAVVRRMVADLSLPVDIVSCPTVREPDGLALSSRNVRLAPDERRAAVALSRALDAGVRALADGERDPARVGATMSGVLAAHDGVAADYAVAVDAATLGSPDMLHGDVRLLVAATVGPVRLIDNVGVLLAPAEAPRARRRRASATALAAAR